MRLLDKATTMLDLAEIGMAPRTAGADGRGDPPLARHRPGHRPHRLGKTTTLYAALSGSTPRTSTSSPSRTRSSTSSAASGRWRSTPRSASTFAAGLRRFLRQDPDVIMVGEIRDRETAEIAIQASLTGHLVFSTVHTNDAAGAVTRLVDMGWSRSWSPPR